MLQSVQAPLAQRPGDAGDLTRFVDHFAILGAPVDFRELCARAVPPATRFVVFDLDRTLHLDRNMGELLGWEICAHLSYGTSYLDDLEAARTGGRIYLERKRLLGSLRYMRLATAHWGPPGLFYLLWGKIAPRWPRLRRHSYLRFGPEPVRAIQNIPQHALMHRIAGLPLATARELAARVWKRYRPDQTVEREDIAWLRQRCPGVRVIISSASPQPTLEAAAAQLGVDAVVYSSLEEHEGRLSAPCDLRRLACPDAAPHRITPPSLGRINAGRAKLDELYARYPALREPGVVSVGISDTGYGEDHCWAEAFTHLIDVNSSSPFPPIVPADARVRTIVSADLLTRGEKAARSAGSDAFLDPRRKPRAPAASFAREQLALRLRTQHTTIEALSRAILAETQRLSDERAVHLDEALLADAAIETAVATFNCSEGNARALARRTLAAELRRRQAVTRKLARVDRPISRLTFALTRELESARAELDEATGR